MRMLCTKLLCCMMALMLMLSLTPAMAATTQLKVELYGLYPMMDGTYQSQAVSAAFDVYQEDILIGTLTVEPDGENTIVLPDAAEVRLAPVPGSYAEELELNAYGYGLVLMPERLNIAPISVYANVAPMPTAEPTVEPTPEPTAEPTAEPTPEPTVEPTAEPTVEPTAMPEPEAAEDVATLTDLPLPEDAQ